MILPKKSPRSEPADRCPRLRLSSANGISSQHLEKEEFGRQAQAVDQSRRLFFNTISRLGFDRAVALCVRTISTAPQLVGTARSKYAMCHWPAEAVLWMLQSQLVPNSSPQPGVDSHCCSHSTEKSNLGYMLCEVKVLGRQLADLRVAT